MTETLMAVRRPRPWHLVTVAAAALLMLLAPITPASAQGAPPSGGDEQGGSGGGPPPGLPIPVGDDAAALQGAGWARDGCVGPSCTWSRIGAAEYSDSLPPGSPPGGERPPVQPLDSGCDPTERHRVTNTTMWRTGSPGPAGSWFGSITRTYNGCGQLVSTRANVECALQTCVNWAAGPALSGATSSVANVTPAIAANPSPRSMVQMETWLWDTEEWAARLGGGHAGVAPVGVVVQAVPAHTTFDTVHQPGTWTVVDSIACPGGGTPWSASATSDCTYIYERPSLETGPSGQNYYAVRARRTYRLECFVDTGGGGSGYTLPSGCNSLVQSGLARLNLPVREAQAVNR